MDLELAPVPAGERMADVAYTELRQAILSGRLSPGTRLSVPALAQQLQVSRSPVRDAVQRLVQEGLAHEEPRRGAAVSTITAADLADIYQVREVLEALASKLAARSLAGKQLALLQGIFRAHQRAVAAERWDEHIELDMRFHREVRIAAGNPHLLSALDEIQTQVRLAMLTTTVTAGPRQALRDHADILHALARGDGEAASSAAGRHVARLRDNLMGRIPSR